jgi:hypothetical protein
MSHDDLRDDDLRQADFSHLSVRTMTRAQRAELKRRYAAFVASFGPETAAKLPAPKKAKSAKPKKWVPGKRA